MADETKRLIIDVTIPAVKERADELQKLAGNIEQLKQRQKELIDTGQQNTAQFEANKAELKKFNAEYAKGQKELLNYVKSTQAADGSLDQMRASVAVLNKEFSAMSEEERNNSAHGKELSQQITELNTKINETKLRVNDSTSNIGKYGQATMSLRQEIRTLTQTLAEMEMAGKGNTKEFGAMVKRLGMLKDTMGDVQGRAKFFADDARWITAASQAVQGLVGAYSIYQGIVALTGEKNEELQKTMMKLQAAMSIMMGLQRVATMLNKDSMVMVGLQVIAEKIKLLFTKKKTVAVIEDTAATVSNTAAVGSNTVATAENAAVTSTSTSAITKQAGSLTSSLGVWGLLIAAIVAAAYAGYEFIKWSLSAAKSSEELTASMQASANSILHHSEKINDELKSLDDYVSKLKDFGKTESQLSQDKIDRINKETSLTQKQYKQNDKDLAKAIEKTEAYIKSQESRKKSESSLIASGREMKAVNYTANTDLTRQTRLLEQLIKMRNENNESLKGSIEWQRKFNEETVTAIKAAEREKERLEKTKKYQDAAAQAYKKMLEDRKKFEEEYYAEAKKLQIEAIADDRTRELAQASFDRDVAYQKREAEIKSLKYSQEREKELLEKFLVYYDNVYQKKRAEINKKYDDKEQKENEEKVKGFSKNIADELKYIQDLETRRRELKKKYWELINSDEMASVQRQIQAEIELENVRWEEEKEKYKDNKSVLEQIERDHQDRLANIKKSAFSKWLEAHQQEIDAVINGLQQISTALGQYYDWKNAKDKQDFETYEASQEAQRKALQARLDAGAISQGQYNSQIAALDQQKDKKRRKLERDAAKRARTQAIINATIQGIQASLSAYASGMAYPFVGPATGAIFAAIAAGFAALQIGLIAATPLPPAARGRLSRGPSHAAGGEVIEVEGGEATLSRKATQSNLPYLDLFQREAGGVPFINDGGFAAAMAAQSMNGGGITAADLSKVKIMVSVDDINRGQNRVKVIQTRANV
jgi:hypothetical protein